MQTLVLGTANFGENYGVANKSGLSAEEVEEILNWSTGKISELDTALDYKGSHSAISKHSAKFKITSKIDLNKVGSRLEIPTKVNRILSELCIDKIERIMLRPHSTDALFTLECIGELRKLLETGRVAEIGLSIYEPEELFYFASHLRAPFVFQVPLNLLNRSFQEVLMSNTEKYRHYKFYIRSIFLQGLLLTPLNELPSHLEEAVSPLSELACELLKIGLPVLDATFSFVKAQSWATGVIVGINGLEQLKRNYKSFYKEGVIDFGFLNKLSRVPTRVIDPRQW
jgi:aryl-alcohol dehydrogenase-like predicted oxidoreductase